MLASPHCPRCGVDLDRDRSRDHLKPKVCPRGHGVFLDAEQARMVFQPAALEPLLVAISAAPFGDVPCAWCGKAMRAFPLVYARPGEKPGAIEADGCPACGAFWFDQGELGAIGGEEFRATPVPGPRASRAVPVVAPRAAAAPKSWIEDVVDALRSLFRSG